MDSKCNEIHDWLQQIYGDAPIPSYELNSTTTDILYKLMKCNKERDFQGQIELDDLQQKTAEYRAEANSTRDVLQRVGITSDSLSKSGVKSLKTLSGTCDALDARDATPVVLKLAAYQRNHDILDVNRELSQQERELSTIIDLKNKALTKKVQLKKLLADLDEESVKQVQKNEKMKKKTTFIKKKVIEYERQLQAFEKQFIKNHQGQEHVTHEELQELSRHLQDVTSQLTPLRAQLDTYHSLPSDLTLTKVKVEEAKLKLEQLDRQLEADILSL